MPVLTRSQSKSVKYELCVVNFTQKINRLIRQNKDTDLLDGDKRLHIATQIYEIINTELVGVLPSIELFRANKMILAFYLKLHELCRIIQTADYAQKMHGPILSKFIVESTKAKLLLIPIIQNMYPRLRSDYTLNQALKLINHENLGLRKVRRNVPKVNYRI